MSKTLRSIIAIAGAAALLLAATLLAPAQTMSDEPSVVSAEVAARALDEARRYAEVTYVVDGEEVQGVAYLWGGRMSVDDFLAAVADGKQPGVEAGADASAVVVNAYRKADSNLRFAAPGGAQLLADATSRSLYEANVRLTSVEALRPGDLLFFSGSDGSVAGVGVFERMEGPNVHFIVASAGSGKVIKTFLNVNNNYWQTRFLAAGQLLRMTR